MAALQGSQQEISSWLHEILDTFRDPETGRAITMNRLAQLTRVAPSTLSRNLKPKPDYTHDMSAKTIRKIALATGIAPPSGLGIDLGGALRGYQPADVERLDDEADDASPWIDRHEGRSSWQITSRVLELAGYLPGDVVIVDPSVAPRNGDAVFAEVYQLDRGTRTTALRIFEQSGPGAQALLHVRSTDPGLDNRTLLVDHERVTVVGTIVSSHRERRMDA